MDVETLFSGQEKRHRAELTEKWKKLKDPSDVYAVSGARWIPFLDLHGTYLSCFTVQSVFNSPMIGHFGFVGPTVWHHFSWQSWWLFNGAWPAGFNEAPAWHIVLGWWGLPCHDFTKSFGRLHMSQDWWGHVHFSASTSLIGLKS